MCSQVPEGSEQVTEFEFRVLSAFCKMNDLPLSNLTEQLNRLTVRAREKTGVGEYVYFENHDIIGRDISAIITGVAVGSDDESVSLGFVLYIKDGLIDMLEGFSYSGEWPEDMSSYEVVLA